MLNRYLLTKQKIEKEYLSDNRPFVITFSGGKDSTLLLHLFLDVVLDLKSRGISLKQSYIVSSDTKVELPIINNFLETNLKELEIFCKKEELPIEVVLIQPQVQNSFFSLMIGKGYPPPNRLFRWCTDRLKIYPITHFFQKLTEKHFSIIILLGVRRDESDNRQRSIDSRNTNHRDLSQHESLANSFVFSPIANWTTDEVWKFLRTNKPQWRESYSELLNIYAKGSGEDECNLSFDKDSPSCGSSRFGCWTCTVVKEDRSMQGMISSGETYLQPLYKYREFLIEIREDKNKRSSRRKNGTSGMGDFLMETRFDLLEKLLQTEKQVGYELISDNEIEQIQKYWNFDGNIDNRALQIANIYRENKFKIDSNSFVQVANFDGNLELFQRIYEIEKQRKSSGVRRGVILEIEERVERHFERIFSENYKN